MVVHREPLPRAFWEPCGHFLSQIPLDTTREHSFISYSAATLLNTTDRRTNEIPTYRGMEVAQRMNKD
jgi:hypothetical protein